MRIATWYGTHGVCQHESSILGSDSPARRLTASVVRLFLSSWVLIILVPHNASSCLVCDRLPLHIYLRDLTHLRCHVPSHTVCRSGLAMSHREARMHRTSRIPSNSPTLSPQYDTIFLPLPFFSFLAIHTHSRWIRMYAKAYVGSDHPRTLDIGYLPPIRMNIEPTKHYQLSGYNADSEWAALAPHNGILHLGPYRQPYSISLFHQLRCLDIIRRDTVESLPPEDSKLSRHCLNYMRQMVLCRADLALDPVLGRGVDARVRPDTNQCVDWRPVYEELEKNQREYERWVAAEHQVGRPLPSFVRNY